MTGPEHYRAAEELLAISTADNPVTAMEAQAHAMLALAAATALSLGSDALVTHDPIVESWWRVAS